MKITRCDTWGLTLLILASLLLKFADYEIEKLGRHIERAGCLRGHTVEQCKDVR